MANGNPFFPVFGPKQAAGKGLLFYGGMFGFGSVTAKEEGFLIFDRGQKWFGDFSITVKDAF